MSCFPCKNRFLSTALAASIGVCGFALPALAGDEVCITPTLIGSYDTPNWVTDVDIVGTTAYVAAWNIGMLIFDMSDPSDPVLLSTTEVTTNFLSHVTVVDNLAYLTSMVAGQYLQIVDVSDPEAPVLLGGLATIFGYSFGNSISISGSIAYVADAIWGLRIIDVSDPDAPVTLHEYLPPGEPTGVHAEGSTVYLAGTFGMEILDLSDPSAPVLIGTHAVFSNGAGIQLVENRVFLAAGEAGLEIVDVSDPGSPVLLGSYQPGFVRDVEINGTIAYVSVTEHGLHVVDVSDVTNPTLIASFDGLDLNSKMAVSGEIVCMGDGGTLFQVIDVSDQCSGCPADFTGDGLLNFFDISAFLGAFAARSPSADINDDGSFDFFDVSLYMVEFGEGCP